MEFNNYHPTQECQFLHLVTDELETYQKSDNRKRVLLFPTLSSRQRYLIHNHIEDLPDLTTFSVGVGRGRRVVVCYSELRRADDKGDMDSESNDALCEGTQTTKASQQQEEEEASARPKTSILSRSRGHKRPDKPLYMPRAARERLSLQNSVEPSGEQALVNPLANCSLSDSCSMPESTGETKSPSTATQDCLPAVTDCVSHHNDDRPALSPHEGEAEVCDQAAWSFAHMTLAGDDKDKEFLSSVPYRDLTEEIKAHLKGAMTVSIEHVHNDFSLYMCVNINLDEFRHVIEIYDFPPISKTDDLLDAFAEYSDGGMKIKWVDDTHALGVFSSELAASHALSICHPMLKARALAQGSKKSKAKALRSAEFLQPVKERPRTDCTVAQRMVARALGLQRRGRVQRY